MRKDRHRFAMCFPEPVRKHHCTSADGTKRCLFISLNRQFLFIQWLEWFYISLLLSSVRDRKIGWRDGNVIFHKARASPWRQPVSTWSLISGAAVSRRMHRLSLGCSFQTTYLYLMITEYHIHSLSPYFNLLRQFFPLKD